MPLKAPNQKPTESDKPATELDDGSSTTSSSFATSSSASQEEHLLAFEANIEQSYLRKVIL